MTRSELTGLLVISASIVPVVMSLSPAVAEQDPNRCSVHDNGSTVDVAVQFSAMVGGSPGGGPRVLGHVAVTPSAGDGSPTVVFHAINTKGAGAERSAGPGGGPHVQCSSSSSRASLTRSTCTISGDAPNETAVVGLLLPAVQKIRDASARSSASGETYEVVLVPSNDRSVGGTRVTCSNPSAARGGRPDRASWDLATSKK